MHIHNQDNFDFSGLNCGFFFSSTTRKKKRPNLVSDGTIKASLGVLVRLYAVRYADMSVLLLLNSKAINVKFMKCKGQIYTSLKIT